jgi:hypothetical protein
VTQKTKTTQPKVAKSKVKQQPDKKEEVTSTKTDKIKPSKEEQDGILVEMYG